MANNYTFKDAAGSTQTGASRDISSVHYPVALAVGGTIGDGRKTVTTSGTEVTLVASTTPCFAVTVTAELDNTDVIVVGSSTVVAALATRQGTPLNPGESLTLGIDDLQKVYIDAVVNGEGVTFSYLAA